jgi:SlyX protein
MELQHTVINTNTNTGTDADSAAAHEDIERRLTNLEIKASFTEDMVEQLNQVIYEQRQHIDALLREVTSLRQQTPDGGSGGFRSLMDERPPHY